MTARVALKRGVIWSLSFRVAGLASIAVLFMLGISSALAAQSTGGQAASGHSQTVPEWQTAAGGTMTFDVASIRPAEPSTFTPPNFALNVDNTSIPPGGRFSADFPLGAYIEFAYKIMLTQEQKETMLTHLPKWVATDSFVVQARAAGNPTKDQMRLMMQSLLADRFKLAVHFETRIVPVLALMTLKPGQTGPRLRRHTEGLACDAKWIAPPVRNSRSIPPGGFLPDCGSVQAIAGPGQTVLLGARNITLEHIASYLPSVRDFGRPVLDQTGLNGTFDFSLNWVPEPKGPLSSLAGAQADTEGPDLMEALKEQLGLKLKPTKAPVKTLVIDHVEEPSPN
jgi:uncharacterized protein (TIGR03435 family)